MNATANYEVTLVIPVCSVEECLPSLFTALDDYKRNTALKFCVLFVNDASNDKSGVLIKDYCMRVNNAFYITLMRHVGLIGSLKVGIERTSSPYVAYMDPLMRCAPADLDLLYEKAKDCALVVGERHFEKKSKCRHLLIRLLNFIRRTVTIDRLEDPSYPAMLMHTEIAKKLPWYSGMQAFIPALVMLHGFRVIYVTLKATRKNLIKRRVSWPCEIVKGAVNLAVFIWLRCRFIDPAVEDGNLKDN